MYSVPTDDSIAGGDGGVATVQVTMAASGATAGSPHYYDADPVPSTSTYYDADPVPEVRDRTNTFC